MHPILAGGESKSAGPKRSKRKQDAGPKSGSKRTKKQGAVTTFDDTSNADGDNGTDGAKGDEPADGDGDAD